MWVIANADADPAILAVADDVYDPADYFDSFDQDTFTHLGAHTTNCEPVDNHPTSWGAVKSLFR